MRGILFSVVLHTLVVLAVALGLPWLAKPPANASLNIAVDIVRLADITQPSKGGKPKPKTDPKPDAERETTRKPVARDRQAAKPPPEPEPVRPKPPAPPKVAEPKPKPKLPAPPKVAKPKPKPKPAPPVKTVVAKPAVKQKIAPPAPPKPKPPVKTAVAKPKTAPPKRVEIDPRALQRQAAKPKKQAPAKKPEPPAPKAAPKPVAKPEKKPAKKPEKRVARPAPKPEKPKIAPKKPEKRVETAAKPKKKPEPKPPKAAKETAPKIERFVAALPRARPPAKPSQGKSAKPPKKTAKKPPAKKPAGKDALDSVFKTVGELKKSEQSDRDRIAAAKPKGNISSIDDRQVTQSIVQAIYDQIKPCWNFLVGARNAESLRVSIKLSLNRDGSVSFAEEINRGRIDGDPNLRAAADAALRAVRNEDCSPLKLPRERYDLWKVLIIDFDPSKLKSG